MVSLNLQKNGTMGFKCMIFLPKCFLSMEQIEKQVLIAIQDLIKYPCTLALLGGSFDLPHLGHVCLALSILSETAADEVGVALCQSSSRKSAPTAPSAGPYVPVGFSSPQAPRKVFPIENFLPP